MASTEVTSKVSSEVSLEISLKVIPKVISNTGWIGFDPNFTMSEDIMKKIASQEFELRNVHCEDDSWIHHFNWHGQPVYTHSATPPDISLWVILSDPPNLNSVALRPIRKQTLIRNAMCYVDPVVVHYNHGVPEDYAGDIPRCTAGLLRFAKGRTFKFYSPHGCWVNDAREREARTKRDEGDADFYYAPNTRVRNGFIDCHIIKPCQMWELRRRVIESMFCPPKRKRWVQEFRNAGCKPSPLRQCITDV